MFDEIWNKQTELMKKFDKIEAGHHLMQVPLDFAPDLNNKFYQARLRDFSQRIIGELAEATEALEFKDFEDFEEEMADVYHFLIELLIISDIPKEMIFHSPGQDLPELFLDVESDFDDNFIMGYTEISKALIKEAAYEFVEKICWAMNELKKKPWKANHDGRETNVQHFYHLLGCAHYDFLTMCYLSGITAQDLYDSYMDKSEVNTQRIESLQ